MTYVDGFVIPVPTARKDEYLEVARESAVVFKKYGAVAVMENWGDEVRDGQVTSFPLAVKLEPGETVVMSWIVWPSKEARTKGMAQAEQDPFFAGDGGDMPFDPKRMILGSFETILDE